jgi:hypothetical protein
VEISKKPAKYGATAKAIPMAGFSVTAALIIIIGIY